MQVYGEDAAEGRAGECVALNVPELDHEAVRRGMVLCAPERSRRSLWRRPNCNCSARSRAAPGYLEAQLHVGTASYPARLAMLDTTEMSAGQKQMVQLRLAAPLPLAPGDRFVLRANVAAAGQRGLTTIGGGRILGLSNARLRRHKPWTLDLLADRREALDDPVRWMELMLRESEPRHRGPLLTKGMLRRAEEIAPAGEAGRRGPGGWSPRGGWLHLAVRQKRRGNPSRRRRGFHAPIRNAPGSAASTAGGAERIRAVRDAAAGCCCSRKHLERKGALLALAGWSARVPDRDQRLRDHIAARSAAGGRPGVRRNWPRRATGRCRGSKRWRGCWWTRLAGAVG